jgi:hypothetical protein
MDCVDAVYVKYQLQFHDLKLVFSNLCYVF